ncbi:MAG: type IV pilus biogenesis protein PilP [Mailhella sp.]|nr:type IV pilus biogenesis protein PilP [Mailhella sp.]
MQDKRKKILIGVAGLCIVAMGALGFAYYSSLTPSRPPLSKTAEKTRPVPVKPLKLGETQTAVLSKKSEAVSVAPITKYDPSTVYSGSLGEVTSLLAGRELSKVAFDMRQNEIKLKELEGKLLAEQVGFFAPPTPVQQEEKAEVTKAPVKAPEVFAVRSVMGSGHNLKAVLNSKSGKYTVKRGDVVPGLGKITSITPDRVEADNKPLPWM